MPICDHAIISSAHKGLLASVWHTCARINWKTKMDFTKKIATLLPNFYYDFKFTEEQTDTKYYLGTISGVIHKTDSYTKTNRFFSKKLWEKIIYTFNGSYKKCLFGPPDPLTGKNNLSSVFLNTKKIEMKENGEIYVEIGIFKNDNGKQFLSLLQTDLPFEIEMSAYGTTFPLSEDNKFQAIDERNYTLISIYFTSVPIQNKKD